MILVPAAAAGNIKSAALHRQRQLSKGKRGEFSEITDEELERIETAFLEAFKDTEPGAD